MCGRPVIIWAEWVPFTSSTHCVTYYRGLRANEWGKFILFWNAAHVCPYVQAHCKNSELLCCLICHLLLQVWYNTVYKWCVGLRQETQPFNLKPPHWCLHTAGSQPLRSSVGSAAPVWAETLIGFWRHEQTAGRFPWSKAQYLIDRAFRFSTFYQLGL